MIDTQFPQQGSLPEDQQNQNPNNEQQLVALPEEVSLIADGDYSLSWKPEDFLTGDAVIDEYLDQYTERFQQEAEDAYHGFQQDKDWLKMAISLWESMRAYYAKDYDEASGATSQGSHAMRRKYELHQRQAHRLVAFFMENALDRLATESQETALQYIEALLDKVRTEYEVAHSISKGTSRMAYMYKLFIHMLEKGLMQNKRPDMQGQTRSPGGNQSSPPRNAIDFYLQKIEEMEDADRERFLAEKSGQGYFKALRREWLREYNALTGKNNVSIDEISRAKKKYFLIHQGDH